MFKALPGGHAVLLACGYPTGRTSLVRLVTHLANYKVFLKLLSKHSRCW